MLGSAPAAIGNTAGSLTLAELDAYDPRSPDKGARRRFCCPLCGEGKPRDAAHRSLSLDTGTGLWKCWRCGAGGKLREFWEERRVKPAVRWRCPRPVPPRAQEKPRADWRRHLSGMCPLTGTPGAAYLAGRGIDPELAQDAGTRYLADWFGRSAVVFPLRDRSGALVGAHARYVDGRNDPKSRTYPAGHGGAFYIPGALASERLVLVEAPIDALSLACAGVFNVLALIGTNPPPWLVRQCAMRRVWVATDADPAGDGAAQRLAVELRALGARVERLKPVEAKDWNDALVRWGDTALAEALEAVVEGA